MDTATKTGIDAAKTASKTVVQKTAKATGDLNSFGQFEWLQVVWMVVASLGWLW